MANIRSSELKNKVLKQVLQEAAPAVKIEKKETYFHRDWDIYMNLAVI